MAAIISSRDVKTGIINKTGDENYPCVETTMILNLLQYYAINVLFWFQYLLWTIIILLHVLRATKLPMFGLLKYMFIRVYKY